MLAHRDPLGPLPLCVSSRCLQVPLPLTQLRVPGGCQPARRHHLARPSSYFSSCVTAPGASFRTPCIIFSFISVILRRGLQASADSQGCRGNEASVWWAGPSAQAGCWQGPICSRRAFGPGGGSPGPSSQPAARGGGVGHPDQSESSGGSVLELLLCAGCCPWC